MKFGGPAKGWVGRAGGGGGYIRLLVSALTLMALNSKSMFYLYASSILEITIVPCRHIVFSIKVKSPFYICKTNDNSRFEKMQPN